MSSLSHNLRCALLSLLTHNYCVLSAAEKEAPTALTHLSNNLLLTSYNSLRAATGLLVQVRQTWLLSMCAVRTARRVWAAIVKLVTFKSGHPPTPCQPQVSNWRMHRCASPHPPSLRRSTGCVHHQCLPCMQRHLTVLVAVLHSLLQ